MNPLDLLEEPSPEAHTSPAALLASPRCHDDADLARALLCLLGRAASVPAAARAPCRHLGPCITPLAITQHAATSGH